MPASRRAGTKPFYIEGLDVETGEWDAPAHDRRYGELQAGVQMATRTMALNELEYSELVTRLRVEQIGCAAQACLPRLDGVLGLEEDRQHDHERDEEVVRDAGPVRHRRDVRAPFLLDQLPGEVGV